MERHMSNNPGPISDSEAMQRIHMILDTGEEFDVDTLDDIADVVRQTGRDITDPDDAPLTRDELIERLTRDYLNTSSSEAGPGFVKHILNNGYKGFISMTYSELLRLAQDAELLHDLEEEEEEEAEGEEG